MNDQPFDTVGRVQLAAPEPVASGYAAWEWTPVSCYAASTTWRLHYPGDGDRYLKVRRADEFPGLPAEARRTWWAGGHLPVPDVIDEGTDGRVDWLVTTALDGQPATDPELGEPRQVVIALAEGLRRFHDAAPMTDCPFEFRIATAMAHVHHRVTAGLVDAAEDFDDEHQHLDAVGVWRRLKRLQPADEELVVCHGDYCPPNALLTGGRVTGYVDLGELGVADRWWDLGVATRAITWNYGPGLEGLFLAAYGAAPDPQRQAFYRLLYDLAS